MDDKHLFSLEGKTVLITGATEEPGFSIACQLAYAGASLICPCANEQELVDGSQAFEEMGIQICGKVCDLTSEVSTRDFINEIMDTFGGVDILVSHVGIQKRMSMTDRKAGLHGWMLDENLTEAFMVSKAIIPGMIGIGGGKIIYICSVEAESGAGLAPTCISARGSLKMLTESIASEYGRYHIQCNGLYPGCIGHQTECSLHRMDCVAGCRHSREDGESGENLAGPVLFLASRASDSVNGQILHIQGCGRMEWG